MTSTRPLLARASQRWHLLVETLRTWPWRQTWDTLRLRFREDRLGVTASSLTFTTTIALVPLFTVMLALFSAFPVFGRFRKALEQQVLAGILPDVIAKQVMLSLTKFAAKASQLGVLGLIGLGVAAMALMLTIDRTLNGIWRVRSARPIAQRVLVYWAALTLGPLLLGASLSVTSYVLSASKGLVGELPGGVGFLLSSILFVLQTAGFAALYKYVPNTFVRTEHAWGGAIFASLGLELAQKGLALYLAKVPAYSTIYGAFAAVPICLIWIYLSWPDAPGLQFSLALAILKALAVMQHSERKGLSTVGLAHHLRTDPLQIEPLLEALKALDWIAELSEPEGDRGARYVLLCDPDHTRVGPLVERLLLKQDLLAQGFWREAALERLTLRQVMS
jgi:membrane protein